MRELCKRLRAYGDGVTDKLARMDALEAANRIDGIMTESRKATIVQIWESLLFGAMITAAVIAAGILAGLFYRIAEFTSGL